MIHLSIIRHAPTSYNQEKRFMGKTIDASIDVDSINYLKNMSEEIKSKYNFDLCFSSPLKRAKETAELLFDCKIIEDPRLIARSIGDWAGFSVQEIKNICSEAINPDGLYNYTINPPNGESYNSTIQRTLVFLEDIILNPMLQNKKIVIVTHGGIAQLMHAMINFMSIDEVFPNTKEHLIIKSYCLYGEHVAKLKSHYKNYLL